MDLITTKNQITEYFSDLQFDPTQHKYAVDGRPIKYSVSGIIKKFSTPFKADMMAEFSARKQGKTKMQVLAEWKKTNRESLDIGNNAHDFGEHFMFDRTLVPQNGYQAAIAKFWTDLPSFVVPFMAEVKMYHKERFYAGTCDILLYNQVTDTFMLGDYKSNKDLFKNHNNQKLRGKFSDLLDNPFNKYQIQLNYYQELIQQIPGIVISKRKVIWVKPDGNYELYECEDYTDRIVARKK